ncbi:MAG TPA: DNA mismatch repair endonuclease MutL [Bryobacteraceae bacterium]|nr:DNA mismatch repair endonuclease MutL [Bryobacteraceae bacterium]
MGRIRVLPDQVANKIAAGEVVERPASVVKELLENSLDAGGQSFRIEIESGGRRLIRVADDGCGMLRDDAMLAFERHATSKLRDVKDLLSIATLGFRGEALPSIASVSRLLLETRAAEENTGTRVEVAGGKMLRCEEDALAPGTTITVRDLFFNVPARKKFLRSEQTELAHVASLVTHYSLAHPDKAFRLSSGAGELLHVTPVETLRERVFQVFGTGALDELVDLGACQKQLFMPPPSVPPSEAIAEFRREPEEPSTRIFRLRGFVSRPQVQKGNRNSIFIFVNGRLIRDRLLLHALSAAYHNLIPPACFPFALLFLECDYEEVDVNVHPSKTEVRFRHQSFVHDFLRDAIRQRLMESRPAPAFPAPPAPQPAAAMPYSEFSQMVENQAALDAGMDVPSQPAAGPQPFPEAADDAAIDSAAPEFFLRPAPAPEPRFDFSGDPIPLSTEPAPPGVRLRVPDTHGSFPAEALPVSASLAALSDLRPLGQIHESFIIAAGREGLWIIDQHVAHERILFEKVLKQRAAGKVEVQHLLMPLVVQLTAEQQIEYARIADELASMGFETEPFGNRTIAVKAAPAALGPADLEKVLFEVLEIAENELRHTSLDDVRRAIAASIACRAAIKINTRLDQNKMDWLLRALAATDCPMSCPHGRPIALQYSMREILKAFHRI